MVTLKELYLIIMIITSFYIQKSFSLLKYLNKYSYYVANGIINTNQDKNLIKHSRLYSITTKATLDLSINYHKIELLKKMIGYKSEIQDFNASNKDFIKFTMNHFKNNGQVSISFIQELLHEAYMQHQILDNIVNISRSLLPISPTPNNVTTMIDSSPSSTNDTNDTTKAKNDIVDVKNIVDNVSLRTYGNITVVGDVHGQYMDFIQIFDDSIG